ncbi:hypothetical protein BH10BAC3_BH10BAC3_17330 [soil metagenome]
MKTIVIIFSFCCATLLCSANTYYVSASGNDENSGLSIGEAWQTLAKVDSFDYQAGDFILFSGGDVFEGVLYNESLVNGTPGSPITFGSYGAGKATISSGMNFGAWIENSGNITIKDLIIHGDGYAVTSLWSGGIYFTVSIDAKASVDNIIIENVEVYGYGGWGITLETLSPTYGYNHVKVNNCSVHDNGFGGLYIDGFYDPVNVQTKKVNSDVYFGYTKAYHNTGRYDYKLNWSGSGILMGGVVGGIIEYCEAYENGNENGSTYAGPVGVFLGECKNVTIQHCISHNNYGGIGKRDGGGFDMDGGAESSVIQYCESYENDGAGYGLYQYVTQNAWTNDTVRYNKSNNDGRNSNLYGAITLWGVSKTYIVGNAQIYGNNISMDKIGTALKFLNNNLLNVQVYDNVFCLTGPAIYSNTIPSNATVINSSFPCAVLSLKRNSFNVKRIQ